MYHLLLSACISSYPEHPLVTPALCIVLLHYIHAFLPLPLPPSMPFPSLHPLSSFASSTVSTGTLAGVVHIKSTSKASRTVSRIRIWDLESRMEIFLMKCVFDLARFYTNCSSWNNPPDFSRRRTSTRGTLACDWFSVIVLFWLVADCRGCL